MKQFLQLGRFYLLLTLILTTSALLVACGDPPTPTATVAPTRPPTPTATPIPPTATPVPPTATLAPIDTTEWGSVKSGGAELKAEPDANSGTLTKLPPFTIVAWRRKLPDESWLERLGGGWVRRQDVVIYNSEEEARRAVPQAAGTPTALPAYVPPSVRVNAPYTFPPVAGPSAIPRQLPTNPVPTQPPNSNPQPTRPVNTPTPVPPTPRFTLLPTPRVTVIYTAGQGE